MWLDTAELSMEASGAVCPGSHPSLRFLVSHAVLRRQPRVWLME
jgi:hypothetical protein